MLILFYKTENPEVAYYVTVTQSMLGKLKNTNYSYYVISVFNIKDWFYTFNMTLSLHCA